MRSEPEQIPGAPPPAADPADVRVATLGGDRACARCAYNLIGQPIVREGRYGLLIVRCPECGAAAGLQEYPLLGRWVARWTALVAALWMLVLLVLLVITAFISAGMAQQLGNEVASPARQAVQLEFNAWWEARQRAELAAASALPMVSLPGTTTGLVAPPAPRATNLWQMTPQESEARILEFFDSAGGVDGIIARHGGWSTYISWSTIGFSMILVVVATACGAVWSVATLGLPRRRLWLVWLALVCAALTVLLLMWLVTVEQRVMMLQSWYAKLTGFADWRLDYPAQAAGFLIFIIALAVGLRIGRPLVRLLATIFLPPRLRWGLAILWTADGRPPPPGGVTRRGRA